MQHLTCINNPEAAKKQLGQVHLPTGNIIACDPLGNPTQAFSQTVPAGDYEVQIYTQEGEHAIACLRFSEAEATRFELATRPNEDVSTLAPDQFFGYGTDTGLGCFMDETTASLLKMHMEEVQTEQGEAFISYYDSVIDPLMAETRDYSQLNFRPHSHNPLNVLIFATGYGDGFYPCYWAWDKDGNLVALLTDFLIISSTEQ